VAMSVYADHFNGQSDPEKMHPSCQAGAVEWALSIELKHFI